MNPGVPALGQYSALPGSQLWGHGPAHKPVTSLGPKRSNPVWSPIFSAAYTESCLLFSPCGLWHPRELRPGASGLQGASRQEALLTAFSRPLLSMSPPPRAWGRPGRGPWVQPLLPGLWAGRDVPGMSDGCHPLVTVLGVLRPQLQGFLVLVAEVDREIMLREGEDTSDYRAPARLRRFARCSLHVSQARPLSLITQSVYSAFSASSLRQALHRVTQPRLRVS